VLTGADYVLLREEFKYTKINIASLRDENWPPERIMVSLGGSDPNNITIRVLEALQYTDGIQSISVIAGPSFVHTESLRKFCIKHKKYSLLSRPENMAELMLSHNIGIGAAGSTSWERCAMGLPTITLVMAENQRIISLQLADTGATRILEQPIKHDILAATILPWMTDKSTYMAAVFAAIDICDGKGTERVIEAILEK